MSNNALVSSSALQAAARAPVTSRPPPAAPPPPEKDEIATLQAALAAALADKAAAEARAATAEAARGTPGKITAAVKSVVKDKDGKEQPGKGGIQIYGVTSKFPITVYLQTLEKMIRAMRDDGIIHAAVRGNMDMVSIRLNGKDAVRCVTPEAVAEAERCLAELAELLDMDPAVAATGKK